MKEATLIGSITHFTTAMFAQPADMKVGYVNAGGGAKRIAAIFGNHTKNKVFGTQLNGNSLRLHQ